MDFVNMLSVGTVYQNIVFYSFLIFIAGLNFELFRHDKELKKFRRVQDNR
jgi:hypothetical protein